MGTFSNCTGLTRVTISGSVSSIGNGAFKDNRSLRYVGFNGSAPALGTNVFTELPDPSYAFISHENIATFGGDGASYHGFTVINSSTVAEASNLYTQVAYNTVVAERDTRLTMEEVKDVRIGSTMIAVSAGIADITMALEETDDIHDWSSATTSVRTIQVNAPTGTRFYRFKMPE